MDAVTQSVRIQTFRNDAVVTRPWGQCELNESGPRDANAFDFNIICLLLERGANVHVQNTEGWTPYSLALIRAKWDIRELMSQYAAM